MGPGNKPGPKGTHSHSEVHRGLTRNGLPASEQSAGWANFSSHPHELIVMERPGYGPRPQAGSTRGQPTAPQRAEGAKRRPKASSCICLAEALGLRFKSRFIDSYKGESELFTMFALC